MNRFTFLNVLERVLSTFGAAFLALYLPAVWAAAGAGDWRSVVALSVFEKAALAGGAAVLSLVKSLVATQVGDGNSGGFLPAPLLKLLKAMEGDHPANTVAVVSPTVAAPPKVP